MQPDGIGTEFLTGQSGTGEFVHQHVMSMLDGAGLSPVPSDQIEATAAFGIGAVVTMQKWRTRGRRATARPEVGECGSRDSGAAR